MQFAPGSDNDMRVFQRLDLDLPEGAIVYAGKAYNSYEYEDFLKENNIQLIAERKANSKRPMNGCVRYLQNYWRKRVETAFSRIISVFPKHIHAVTGKGFSFILIYSLNLLL